LGQGYMNWAPPEYVRKAAADAIQNVETNHYSVTKGRARLRNALSKWFSPRFGRHIDPDTEIVVTAGANEGKLRCSTFWFTGY
jgi:kynurenine aminotransferase